MDYLLSKQLGKVDLFSIFEVEESEDDKYLLQVLKLEPDKSTFLKYYKDEKGIGHQGILCLDSNAIFDVGSEIIKLKNVTELPLWVHDIFIDPIDYLLDKK
jgi:hypothetical protein